MYKVILLCISHLHV